MRWRTTTAFAALLGCSRPIRAASVFPIEFMRGVNLGNWLLFEPWMALEKWSKAGGGSCGSCQACSPSAEYDLVKKIGQKAADAFFEQHWSDWFQDRDVQEILDADLNHVRLPVGFWIVEALKLDDETWPNGGFKHLRRGLDMLRKANITVAIDHHAAPGISAANQMFAGRCVPPEEVRFYEEANLSRAYQFLSIMTALSYRDPVFDSVISLMMLNEPDLANHYEGYATFVERSIRTVRATEYALGITCSASHNFTLDRVFGNAQPPPAGTAPSLLGLEDKAVQSALREAERHIKAVFKDLKLADPWPARSRQKRSMWSRQKAATRHFYRRVERRLTKRGRIPISDLYCTIDEERAQTPFSAAALPLGPTTSNEKPKVRDRCLALGFMDKSWQGGIGSDPKSFANGPMYTETHPYAYFNPGVPVTEAGYLSDGCSGGGLVGGPVNNEAGEQDNKVPMIAGEWWIATHLDDDGKPKPSNDFYRSFADRQKAMYAKNGDGWVFWSFKIENDKDPTRDYLSAVRAGYMDKNASAIVANACG